MLRARPAPVPAPAVPSRSPSPRSAVLPAVAALGRQGVLRSRAPEHRERGGAVARGSL